jgi:predicted RNA-binding protein with RPS1 domain
VFIDFGLNKCGLAHISRINHSGKGELRTEDLFSRVKEGDPAEATILEITRDGKIRLGDASFYHEAKPGVQVLL